MTGMNLNLDEAAIASVLSQAILEGIGEQGRDNLIAQAVTHIMKTPRDRYGVPNGQETPLQVAFSSAIHSYVNKAVQDVVDNSEELRNAVDQALGPIISGSVLTELRGDWDLQAKIGRTMVEHFIDRHNKRFE
jgi:hypothetical protein